ncbi:MAG: hypothetical protein AAB638_01220 [Patescibacteria group bacterium]
MEDRGMKVSARITAEMLLGKIRINHRQSEPGYLMPLRQFAMQIKKGLGEEEIKVLSEDLLPVAHAVVDLLFDAVTDSNRPATIEAVKKLSIPHRTTVETLVNMMTGKMTTPPGRWLDELWRTKQSLRQMTDLSISGLTLEEIREGYNPFVHAVVDELWKHRDTLVS